MNKNEKYRQNSLNNTNTSINFILDSLNKTEFEIVKQMNQKSKDKYKKNLFLAKNKKNLQSEMEKKPRNKLESILLNSKKNYSKYNKVPHQVNKITNVKIGINKGKLNQERGSDLSFYKYYNSNTYNSMVSESGDSKSIKSIKNSHSFKKNIKNEEGKYTINKYLKNNMNNYTGYKANIRLKPKIKIQINEQKLNSFKKVPNKNKIKIKESDNDEIEIIENYFLLNNAKSENNLYNDNSQLLYVIDDEQNNIYQNINNPKKYANKKDYDLILNNKENNNIEIISFELLKLNERKWFDELDEISNILIEKRENLNDIIYNKYIHKILKLHEHFNWIIYGLGRYFNNIIFENSVYNPSLNYNNLDLPRFEYIWFKGFKWKGLFIRAAPQDKSKYIVNEIKALNYYFLDYLQIIDNYKYSGNNKKLLSNYIILPLIGYVEVNGFILYSSCLINLENNLEHEQTLFMYLEEIIKENKGHVKLYSSLINLSYYISINKDKNYNKNNKDNPKKLFIDLMQPYYDIKDLSYSQLFSNLNMFHFIKTQKEKFLIFNVAEFIPKLFETKIKSTIKLNFFSIINNSRKYYSINYDISSKNVKDKDKDKEKKMISPVYVLETIYNMDIESSLKKKDIIMCGIHFRILYEAQHINNKDSKNKCFVDYLFNYDNYNNLNKNNFNNNKYESYVVEPYVILYDLIEPIKLKYSLIKNSINYKYINDNNTSNIYYFNTNYLSYFISWCKMINNNNLDIKNYSALKQNMSQYGINSNFKYFSLFILNNKEIIDIIKISLLIKGIKFILNKKYCEKIIEKIKNDNQTSYHNSKYTLFNNSFNNNLYKNIRIIRILYSIQSILYPKELLSIGKNFIEFFYQNLIFYFNIIFIKFKLIDEYLSLGILNTSNNNGNIFHIINEYKSPKSFLKDIIKTARKKPFLFIKEMENKLHFILNPYILFKSSLSIESMYKKLESKYFSLNLNNINHSYIKSDEISGIILAKIINNYEYLENKIKNKNFANKSIKIEQYDADGNVNYDSLQNFDNYINNENYIDNESHNSTYDSRKNNIIDFDNMSFMTSKINISDSLGLSSKINQDNNMNKTNKNNDMSSVINNILSDFIIQLSPNCYKMNYNYENLEESSLLVNKYKNNKEFQIYRKLKAYYKISEKKILESWIEYNESIFHKITTCNGIIEHSLLKSYIYQLLFSVFIEKSREISKFLIEKIKLIYKNGAGYLLPLNDLAIINLFEGLINEKDNDLIESVKESSFSKALIFLLMNYGDPRGRNNDSHKILLFPIWKLLNQIYEIDPNSIMVDYFREMFLSLDYIERSKIGKNKSKNEEKELLFKKDNNKNILDNNLINKNEIQSSNNNNLLVDSLNFDSFHFNNKLNVKHIQKNDKKNKPMINDNLINKEFFLSNYFFNNALMNKICSKYFTYPLIDVFDSFDLNLINNNENQFFSNEFILYFLKAIQNLLSSNEIIFDEKYINENISNDIIYRDNININIDNEIKNKRNSIPLQIKKSKSQKGLIIAKTESKQKKENQKLSFKNNSEKCIKKANSFINNIFSHFLYKELLQKLSYKSNAPSGVIISFGNNCHNETGIDKADKITTPHIIFKLKNEIINHIYAGWEHNIIITNEGEIFSFGHNQFYQCGVPNLNKVELSVKDPQNISFLNNIKAISASCGNEHTLILSKEYTVYSFGNTDDGVLGINIKDKNNSNKDYKFNKIDFGEYTNKIIEISSGTVHNLALTYDGKVFSWGSSQGGQLGLPLQILENYPDFKNNYYISNPINIPIINKNKDSNSEINIIKISCGEAHNLALSSEGKVYCWGFGSNGQLGLGFCEDSFEPGEGLKNSIRYEPEKIEELKDEIICDINCGKTFSMFINNKGELFGCGVNDLNQLGIQEMPTRDHLFNKSEEMCYDFVYPTKVDYFLNMKVEKISCGEGHCLAVIKDILSNTQTIWSWGNNKFGQLGQGTIIKKCFPRPINYLFEYNSYKFDEIACGGFHSLCLIKHNENINWIKEDYEKIICRIIDDIRII